MNVDDSKNEKLSLFAMFSDREALLHELMLLGCVEVIPHRAKARNFPTGTYKVNALERDYRNLYSKATAALGILNRYAPLTYFVEEGGRRGGAFPRAYLQDERCCLAARSHQSKMTASAG